MKLVFIPIDKLNRNARLMFLSKGGLIVSA